jgi:GAF domain-containing protein
MGSLHTPAIPEARFAESLPFPGRTVRAVDERETRDVEELVRENANLRDQQRGISDVLRAVASSEGLQPVLDEIVAAAKRLCRGEHAQLYLAEGDQFHIFSQSFDLSEAYDYAAEHPHARDRTTVVGRVGLTGEVEQIADVLGDPEYAYEGQRMVGYRALLGVPIVLDGELIGVIAVGRHDVGPFADEHIELVKTFADQAAIAIANARLLDAVERQRTELARFISPPIAELISSEQGEQLLAGHRSYISCLFSTSAALRLSPRRLRQRSYWTCFARTTKCSAGSSPTIAGPSSTSLAMA